MRGVPSAPYPPLSGSEPCVGADPEVFFPPDSEDGATAKALCELCPVLRECLAYALTHPVDGVWVRTTSNDRRQLRRRFFTPTSEPELDLMSDRSAS